MSLHAWAIDPSGFRPNRRSRSASFAPALLYQRPGGSLVAGDGAGAHYLLGFVRVAAVGQQVGQRRGGKPVAGVGAGAELVQVAALGQQVSQPPGGESVAGVGAGAELVQVAALGQEPGQLPGGSLVAGAGAGAELVQVAAPGQPPGHAPGGDPSPASARARSWSRSPYRASSLALCQAP